MKTCKCVVNAYLLGVILIGVIYISYCGICLAGEAVEGRNAMLKVDGVELYYEVHGNGRPLLLIAGLGSDSQSWISVLNLFAQTYKVIVVDNRGTGRSIPQDADTSVGLIADDCIALLDHLEIDSCDIVGHSMGGFVALDIAIRYPNRIGNLALSATSAACRSKDILLFDRWVEELEDGMGRREWFKGIFKAIFTKKLLDNSEMLEMFLDFSVTYPYPQTATAFVKQIEAIKEYDARGNLGSVRARTLILCGAEDILFEPEVSIEELGRIEDSRSMIIDGAAHSIHLEKPEEFVKAVSGFLESE